MTLRCRAGLGAQQNTSFCVMDGEAPSFAPGEHFDLICSSLAFQWFENLPGSLAKLAALLRPGGHIAFSTLAAGSFAEWRRAYDGVGEKPSVLNGLPITDIHSAMPRGDSNIDEQRIVQPYANGHAFLSKLRQIGAHTPPKGGRPASAGTLRRVLRAFDSNSDRQVSFHVAYGVFTRP